MKKIITLLLIFVYTFTPSMYAKNKKEIKKVDICVYGGTASGVIAAYSAKKMGKSVILIEPGKYLGGMTTAGLGATDIGNKYAVTGLARLFYRRIGDHYNRFEQWTFPPSVATEEIHRFVKDGNLDVLYYRRITDLKKKGKDIQSITLEDSRNPESESFIIIEAKQYIDCSYEGDLMARSGTSYFVGREDNSLYDETLNGVQLLEAHQFPDGIDPYIVEGDPSSGLCWGIMTDTLAPNGTGDKKVQAYNFRLCLTNRKDNIRPFEKPEVYDPSMYELIVRASKKMNPNMTNFISPSFNMPDQKYDVNNIGPLSTDMIGMNYDYPEADYTRRAEIVKAHENYTKGLLYFLSHDERMPAKLREQMQQWGYAKDEFVDNDNFPPQLYIREARRMIGEYVMTQKNCQGEETVGDGIGMAAYGMDSHNCQRIVVNGMVKNEGDVQYHGFAPYPISYRSIIPKKEQCTNLFVPVCMSATHIAYGSIRMEPVFMVLGQSAAVAASLAIDSKQDVQDVDVKELRRILREDPYLDGSIPEILVDDTDIDKVKRSGPWVLRVGRNYKTNYAACDNANRTSYYSFFPRIKQEGKYDVYFYCTAISDGEMPETMVFDIKHANGTTETQITPRTLKGQWVNLGSYSFNKEYKGSAITVNGKKTEGPIFVDAVILVPHKN